MSKRRISQEEPPSARSRILSRMRPGRRLVLNARKLKGRKTRRYLVRAWPKQCLPLKTASQAARISRVITRCLCGAEGLLSAKAAVSGRAEARAVVVVSKKSISAPSFGIASASVAASLYEMWATVAGYDIVVSVHSDISGLPTPKLRELLLQALRRARVLAPNRSLYVYHHPGSHYLTCSRLFMRDSFHDLAWLSFC